MNKETRRLVVDGKGTEKIIYQRPTFEIPREQVITFPDKKEIHVDWRRNFDRITQISNIIEEAEIVQEEGTFVVPFSNPEIPYAMGLNFSDGHIGPWTTDHELVKELLETVLVTPNSFLVDTGDTFDNGIWGGMQWQQVLPPYMQNFTIKDIMRELGDKYAACVIGNHAEWLFNTSGIKPEVVFAKQMKGPVFAGMGLLHLEVGDQKYDWALTHTYWGKSKKNIFNTCVNFRNHEYPNADIFSVAHEHIWGIGEEMVDGKMRLYIRPGTAKLRDRYARMHGIARRGQACGIAVIFGAKERSYKAYNIKDAVDLMNVRKKLAEFIGDEQRTLPTK